MIKNGIERPGNVVEKGEKAFLMKDDPQQQETARTRILALIKKRPLPWSEEGSERG